MTTRRVLVKLGGAALMQRALLTPLVEDLKRVYEGGDQLLLVHGGGPQATQLTERLGLEPTFRAGRRVTDSDTLEVVKWALVGQAGTDLLAALRAHRLPAVATSASSGGFVQATKRPPRRVAGVSEPVDFGWVADVVTVDSALLECLWSGGFVPSLSSVVIDADGQPLNLNADTLVSGICRHVHFDAVVFVADVPGVYGDLTDPRSHLPQISPNQVTRLVESGVVQGGMVAKLSEMVGLLDSGVESVWIVGLHEPNPVSSALSGAPGTRTKLSATPSRLPSTV